MSALNRNTRRRLNKLQQTSSVWEGDRRPLSVIGNNHQQPDGEGHNDCILWVDGSEGIVRAMDLVSPTMGPEAIVRALMQAMEHPQSPARPARPSKIVVRNREIQFFLRGVLQGLDIGIDYVPNLPLIDELFRGFEEMAATRQPQLPPKYADLLIEKAYEIWHEAAWEVVADHQIISIELNRWDVETLYVSVMGMLGMEYGVLLYRSWDSLKRFRSSVLADDSWEKMEQAFLGQDCLFLTFGRFGDDSEDEDEEDDIDLADLPVSEIVPGFGTVHPLEGMRPYLYEEEAIAIYVALEAIQRFVHHYHEELDDENLPKIGKRYRIPVPLEPKSTVNVKVNTHPDLADELLEMAIESEEDDFDSESMTIPLRDDLVPKDAFLKLGMMSWEAIESIRSGVKSYQSQNIKAIGEGMPVILIQTTRPKAQVLIEQIETAGGLKGICFNSGEDPFEGTRYDLGIIQTENSSLYLLGEFSETDTNHAAARQQWEEGCQNQGYCGLVIARGLAGASRGNPKPRDMMALFEARSLSTTDLGIAILKAEPSITEPPF
ncbi:hypothetical protein BJP36_31780 [Moorena producens JHB]|uniref:Uncharacterized protein n=1 Tax=Moorena producens (strain JHB) TaxID=1454205 RepID=A0A1D9G8V4_MOOP1|nr:hypothetical protein [Moorena producens]AOY83820.1 hypothetical protein BJP36_31780 [Moorena producens JHB]